MKTSAVSAPLEKHLQEACARILELDGWRRLRTDPVSRRDWGKGFGEPGMADDLFLRYCDADSYGSPHDPHVMAEVLWVEWKRLRPSKRGTIWQRETRAANHHHNYRSVSEQAELKEKDWE